EQAFTTLPALVTQLPLAPPIPRAELTRSSLQAGRSGKVGVRISCPAAESFCRGTVTLRAREGKRTVTLAKGSFSVAGGHAATIELRLSSAARKLLARRRVLHAVASVVA